MKVELSEFKDLAYRAFYWTSFNPKKRGEDTIKSHEEQLNEDLLNIPEEEKERYISNYKKYFSAWLSAHSRCASSAITGGSGFNVRRAEKANASEHNRMMEFSDWRERALKAIAKKIEDNKPQSVKNSENWDRLRESILSSAATIHGINTGIERGYSKALFVSSIYQKVETYAKHGNVEIVSAAIEEIRKFNETMSVVITERHKFFKLLEMAENVKSAKESNAERENSEIAIPGGKVVQNWKENRLQIIFDNKPDYDTIRELKKWGFKWAPSVAAWQRFNNNNSIFALKQIIKYLKEK